MPDTLDVATNLLPYIILPMTTFVAEARNIMQNAQVSFAIVTNSDHMQALLHESHLTNLLQEKSKPLAIFLAQFSPLLLYDVEHINSSLTVQEIQQLVLLLKRVKAMGVVVMNNDQPGGILSRQTLFRALPLKAISVPGSEEKLYGGIDVPPPTFVCRKCPPPYPRRRPRLGSETPLCPVQPQQHGKMEREDI
jgi:hypothetical protein